MSLRCKLGLHNWHDTGAPYHTRICDRCYITDVGRVSAKTTVKILKEADVLDDDVTVEESEVFVILDKD